MDAYRAKLKSFDPDIAHAIAGEERRQLDGVEMITSENYTYPEVLAALGSVLTNKYSEGYPGRRYYGGQKYTAPRSIEWVRLVLGWLGERLVGIEFIVGRCETPIFSSWPLG